MAVFDTLSIVYAGAIPNGPVSRLFRLLLPDGDISTVRVKLESANASADVVFGLSLNGTPLFTNELTIAGSTDEIEVTGLTETVDNDTWAVFSIEAPFTSGALSGITSIGFHITYDVTIGGSLADGDYGDVTVSSSGTAIAIDNNAVTYAKMQDVSATSRLLGRKTTGSGDPEEITIQEALNFIASLAQGDILYHNGTNFVRLAAGTSGQFLKTLGAGANPAWDAIAGGGDLLSTNNLSDLANASTARTNLGVAIGTHVQAYDADLTTWAGITPGTSVGAQLALAADGSDSDAIGFRGIPQNAQTGNYTLVMADAGKHIYHASGAGAGDTYTIPANSSVAFEIGTSISFCNLATDAISIAITTDTMHLSPAGTTGTRTLAQYGICTAIKVTSTVWIISGTNLT